MSAAARCYRVTTSLRRALAARNHLLGQPISSFSTSTPSKQPKTRKPTLKPLPHSAPASWPSLNAASAQIDRIVSDEKSDLEETVNLDEKKWPRPSQLPWMPEAANFVKLIGQVKMPVRFLAEDGDKRNWATTVIVLQTGSSSNPLWIPVLFDGDLANVVACHVKENDYVYVAGSLSAEQSPFSPNAMPEHVQVLAQSINFVDESTRANESLVQLRETESSHHLKERSPVINQPSQKVSNSVHEEIKAAMMPTKLPPLEVKPGFGNEKKEVPLQVSRKKEQFWKEMVGNPDKFWDNRSNKPNRKAPDFVHKETKEGLWLNNAPEWVTSVLPPLEAKAGSGNEKKETLVQVSGEKEKSWKEVVENHANWWDKRLSKCNEKAPDFVHKETKEALWLSSAPDWVISQLPRLKGQLGFENENKETPFQVAGKHEKSWKEMVENPDKWWDNRLTKQNERQPDFKHRDTGEALWLNSAPAWVLSHLTPLRAKPGSVNARFEAMAS